MEARTPVSSHVVGEEYLQTHSLEQRRAAGRVYTPTHIVQFVLEQVGYEAEGPNSDKGLLDPACGAGAFLEQALSILLRRMQRRALEARTISGFRRFLGLIEERLWGIDSDEQSCEIARQVVVDTVEYLTGRRPPHGFFHSNILTADFLLDAAIPALPPIRDGTLGFLVGNPPYVQTTRLSSQYKERLRGTFASAT